MRGFALGLSLSVAFAIGCVSASVIQPSAGAQPPPGTLRWSYVCSERDDHVALQRWMNEMGELGFEGMGVGAERDGYVACMKRPL